MVMWNGITSLGIGSKFGVGLVVDLGFGSQRKEWVVVIQGLKAYCDPRTTLLLSSPPSVIAVLVVIAGAAVVV